MLGGLADAVGSLSSQYQAEASGVTGGARWSSEGSASFEAAAGRFTQHLGTLRSGLRQAASALTVYAGALESAQALARSALSLESHAQADASAAQSSLASTPAPPASASPAQQAAAQAATVRAQTSINDNLSSAMTRVAAMQSQASSAASSAAAAAAAQLDAVSASLGTLATDVKSQGAAPHGDNGGEGEPLGKMLNDWGAFGLTPFGAFTSGLMSKHYVDMQAAEADVAKFTYEENLASAIAQRAGPGSLHALDAWYRLQEANPAYAEATGSSLKATKAFGEDVVPGPLFAASSTGAKVLNVAGRAALGLGMASDVMTFAYPHPGALGVADRAMAVANFGASSMVLSDLFLATTLVPGVGEAVVGAVLLGTAAYFAGTFVYDHWDAISGGIVAANNWVNRQEGAAVSWVMHEGDKTLGWVNHELSSGTSWVGNEASHVVSGAKNVVDGIGNAIMHPSSWL